MWILTLKEKINIYICATWMKNMQTKAYVVTYR